MSVVQIIYNGSKAHFDAIVSRLLAIRKLVDTGSGYDMPQVIGSSLRVAHGDPRYHRLLVSAILRASRKGIGIHRGAISCFEQPSYPADRVVALKTGEHLVFKINSPARQALLKSVTIINGVRHRRFETKHEDDI